MTAENAAASNMLLIRIRKMKQVEYILEAYGVFVRTNRKGIEPKVSRIYY